jgi:hypothetical protein
MTVGYPVPPGPSILEMMWDRIVEETEELLRLGFLDHVEDYAIQTREQRASCLGMAEMIAILLNPYNPSTDEVRTEVMRRIGERTSA